MMFSFEVSWNFLITGNGVLSYLVYLERNELVSKNIALNILH